MAVEQQQAVGNKGSTFMLLGRLVDTPPCLEHLPALAEVPAMAEAFSSLPHHRDGRLDEEESAALHQEIFGFNILPFAGVYLSDDGSVGGTTTDRILELQSGLGIDHDPLGESPEHLGRILQLVASLSRRTETPIGSVQRKVLSATLERLLDDCLLSWLPPICAALQQTNQPYYSALSQTIWHETIALRRGGTPYCSKPFEWENGLLDDPKTGLREIAAFLASPNRSGAMLSTQIITAISRQAGTPRGFGGRQQMLETLLFSAADQGALPRIVGGLLETLEKCDQIYAKLADTVEPARLVVEPWRRRLHGTQNMLGVLADAATT